MALAFGDSRVEPEICMYLVKSLIRSKYNKMNPPLNASY